MTADTTLAEEKPVKAGKSYSRTALDAVANFDRLPKKAQITTEVFLILKTCSQPTFWRMRKAGKIPPPIPGIYPPRWYVEDVRRHLDPPK